MKTIALESDQHWHALRAKHIGGSDIAALFDLSPYITRYMLWHEKNGSAKLPDPEQDNDRVWWGKKLEPIIAERVAHQMRWQLEERKVYCQAEDVAGMGCTIDRFIVDHEDGPGLVQIKMVDWLVWRSEWTDTNAPNHIEVQVQHEFGVTGYAWGAIACFVQGSNNEVLIYPRKPHEKTIAQIKEAVGEFWGTIKAGKAPEPFGSARELDTLSQLINPPSPELTADLSGDPGIFETAREFQWAREQESFHSKMKDAAKVKLLSRIGKAQLINLPGFDIRRNKAGALYRCEMRDGAVPPEAPNDAHAFI